jgi:hypothetical protein
MSRIIVTRLLWDDEYVYVAFVATEAHISADLTDRGWITEIAIPFADLAPFGPNLPPHDGDHWRLNLYRMGGEVNPQFSLWSDTRTQRPQYHKPDRFGLVHFSTNLAGSSLTSS